MIWQETDLKMSRTEIESSLFCSVAVPSIGGIAYCLDELSLPFNIAVFFVFEKSANSITLGATALVPSEREIIHRLSEKFKTLSNLILEYYRESGERNGY